MLLMHLTTILFNAIGSHTRTGTGKAILWRRRWRGWTPRGCAVSWATSSLTRRWRRPTGIWLHGSCLVRCVGVYICIWIFFFFCYSCVFSYVRCARFFIFVCGWLVGWCCCFFSLLMCGVLFFCERRFFPDAEVKEAHGSMRYVGVYSFFLMIFFPIFGCCDF